MHKYTAHHALLDRTQASSDSTFSRHNLVEVNCN